MNNPLYLTLADLRAETEQRLSDQSAMQDGNDLKLRVVAWLNHRLDEMEKRKQRLASSPLTALRRRTARKPPRL